jgi:hypothetical protein
VKRRKPLFLNHLVLKHLYSAEGGPENQLLRRVFWEGFFGNVAGTPGPLLESSTQHEPQRPIYHPRQDPPEGA